MFFLEAARRIGANPKICVVLEDAESGIRAGKAAKMKVIAVPSQYTLDNDFTKADMVVGSLEELSLEKIEKLVFAG